MAFMLNLILLLCVQLIAERIVDLGFDCNGTVVTGYWNLPDIPTRGDLHRAGQNLMRLRAPLVVFTDQPDQIWRWRRGVLPGSKDLSPLTRVIYRPFARLWSWQKYEAAWLAQFTIDPEGPRRSAWGLTSSHSPRIYAIRAEKTQLLREAALRQDFRTNHFFWVDLDYFSSGTIPAHDSAPTWPHPAAIHAFVPRGRILISTVRDYTTEELESGASGVLQSSFGADGPPINAGLFGGSTTAVDALWQQYHALLQDGFFATGAFAGKEELVFSALYAANPALFALVADAKLPANYAHRERLGFALATNSSTDAQVLARGSVTTAASTRTCRIHRWLGRLGNEVMQLANALRFATTTGCARLVLPESTRELPDLYRLPTIISIDRFDSVVWRPDDCLSVWPFCFEDFDAQRARSDLDYYLSPFRDGWAPSLEVDSRDSNEIVIHLRSGDLPFGENGATPDALAFGYRQPPCEMYMRILLHGNNSYPYVRARIVTEPDRSNPCVKILVQSPRLNATKITVQSHSQREDALTIVKARRLVMACSTFSGALSLLNQRLGKLYVPSCLDTNNQLALKRFTAWAGPSEEVVVLSFPNYPETWRNLEELGSMVTNTAQMVEEHWPLNPLAHRGALLVGSPSLPGEIWSQSHGMDAWTHVVLSTLGRLTPVMGVSVALIFAATFQRQRSPQALFVAAFFVCLASRYSTRAVTLLLPGAPCLLAMIELLVLSIIGVAAAFVETDALHVGAWVSTSLTRTHLIGAIALVSCIVTRYWVFGISVTDNACLLSLTCVVVGAPLVSLVFSVGLQSSKSQSWKGVQWVHGLLIAILACVAAPKTAVVCAPVLCVHVVCIALAASCLSCHACVWQCTVLASGLSAVCAIAGGEMQLVAALLGAASGHVCRVVVQAIICSCWFGALRLAIPLFLLSRRSVNTHVFLLASSTADAIVLVCAARDGWCASRLAAWCVLCYALVLLGLLSWTCVALLSHESGNGADNESWGFVQRSCNKMRPAPAIDLEHVVQYGTSLSDIVPSSLLKRGHYGEGKEGWAVDLAQLALDARTLVLRLFICLLFVYATQRSVHIARRVCGEILPLSQHAAFAPLQGELPAGNPESYAALHVAFYCFLVLSVALMLVIQFNLMHQNFGLKWSKELTECRRSLIVFFVVFCFLFASLRWSLSDKRWSGFWRTDCSEFARREGAWSKESFEILNHLRHRISAGSIQISKQPNLCVAIPTVRRQHSYLTHTVSSLLGGLSDTELSNVRVHLIGHDTAIPQTLHGLEPLVVQKSRSSASGFSHSWRKQETLDYIVALESCLDSPAALILEDDTHATEHVVDKIRQAVEAVSSQSAQWLLVKLFQPVWGNPDHDWGAHIGLLSVISLAIGSLIGTLIGRIRLMDLQTIPGTVVFCLCCSALSCFTFVAIGKPTLDAGWVWLSRVLWVAITLDFGGSAAVLPIQVAPRGTCHMSQANLFNTDRTLDLIDYLRANADFDHGVDLQICRFFADPAWATDHTQWASEPSLFQHVGRYSSGGSGKNQGDCAALHQSATWTQD